MSHVGAAQMSKIRGLENRAVATLLAAATVVAGSAVIVGAARAQTPSPLAEWQYSAGIPLETLYEPEKSPWRIRLGPAASVQPWYEGASRYHVIAGPSIDIRYRDWFFASTGEGVGFNVLNGPNWRAGVAVSYDLGRRAADDPGHLSGLGNIHPAPEIKLVAEYVVSKEFPLVLRADIRRNLGGSDGWIGDVGAYLPLPGSSPKFFWFAGPSLTFADARYMNAWFGVNRVQAAQSGYRSYSANAGLKSVGVGVSAAWNFREHWFVSGNAAIEQLVGSAAHSPITQRATNGVFNLALNYQF
jgi:outer membrane scaffolding protein for murein synthesis (MipA/OmpV family)